MTSLIELLSSTGYITVNKTIAKECGIYEALMLGELCSEYLYWKNREMLEDGWFFSTVENIEENTALTPYQQRQAIEHLEQLGIISKKNKGMPSKRYFKINEDKIASQLLKNLTTRSEKTEEQEVKKLNTNKNNNNNKNKNNKENHFASLNGFLMNDFIF